MTVLPLRSRWSRAMAELQKVASELNQAQVGKRVRVLVEEQGVGRTDHDRREDQDPDGVRQADRQSETERMTGCPPRPDEIRGHQGLAMARRQSVARPQTGRRDQREHEHERGQLGRAEDLRQFAATGVAPRATPVRYGDAPRSPWHQVALHST